MIPEGWKQELVDDLCSQISVGIVVKPADYYVDEDSGIRAFRSANVGEGFVKNKDWIYISDEGHRINRKSVLRTNDVLIVRTGYPGTACLVPPEYEGSNCIDIIFARPKPERIVPSYLCVFTNSEYGKKQVLDGQGGLAQQHFNVGAFKQIKIPLPPLSEQRRIAEILATWDRAIETVEALIANARAQKKALMQSLLTGKRRLPGFSGEWKAVKLGQICSPKQWVTISAKEMTETGVPVFGANGFIGHYHTANHNEDTVVISCRGSCGEVHIVPGPSYITGNAMCLDGASENGIQLNVFAELIRRAGTQSMISGSAQPQIVRSTVANFQITIPDAVEQIALSSILRDADDTILTLQSQLAALCQEKSALMQQLLTGKRRVKLDLAGAIC